MRKLLALAVIGIVGMAFAASVEFVGRVPRSFTAATTFSHTSFAKPVMAQQVLVTYAGPTTNTLYVIAEQDGVRYNRYVYGPFTNAASVLVVLDSLWMKKGDKVVVSNAVSAAATAVIDYVK